MFNCPVVLYYQLHWLLLRDLEWPWTCYCKLQIGKKFKFNYRMWWPRLITRWLIAYGSHKALKKKKNFEVNFNWLHLPKLVVNLLKSGIPMRLLNVNVRRTEGRSHLWSNHWWPKMLRSHVVVGRWREHSSFSVVHCWIWLNMHVRCTHVIDW